MTVSQFKIGDRVRVVDQPSITGTVVRYDVWNKLVILDDDREEWAEEGEEGVLVFRASELEPKEATQMTTPHLPEQTSAGKYPAYAWPGGYPMYYLASEGAVLCPTCANDPDTADLEVRPCVYWEGPSFECDGCDRAIESAYGDPEEEDADA